MTMFASDSSCTNTATVTVTVSSGAYGGVMISLEKKHQVREITKVENEVGFKPHM